MRQDGATPTEVPTPTPPAEEVIGLGALERMALEVEQWGVVKGPAVVLALVLLIIAWIVAGTVRGLVIRALTRAKLDLTLAKFFGNLSRWAILVFAIVTCMGTLGINTTSLAAVVGAAGLAIGLALQGNLGNLASGVLLLVFRPFKIGDSVIVAGQPGIVDGIDLFTTYLDTPDNRRIIVPNNAIFSGVIENQTRHPHRRVDVTLQVAGSADPQDVESGLRAAASRVVGMTEGARRDPGPSVSMTELQPATWTVQVGAERPRVGAVRQALLREVRRWMDDHKMHPAPAPTVVRITEMPALPEPPPRD